MEAAVNQIWNGSCGEPDLEWKLRWTRFEMEAAVSQVWNGSFGEPGLEWKLHWARFGMEVALSQVWNGSCGEPGLEWKLWWARFGMEAAVNQVWNVGWCVECVEDLTSGKVLQERVWSMRRCGHNLYIAGIMRAGIFLILQLSLHLPKKSWQVASITVSKIT